MRWLYLLIFTIFLGFVGNNIISAPTQVHNTRVDGYFWGSMEDYFHGCLMSHIDQRSNYLGFYTTNKDVKRVNGSYHCNLAIGINYNGDSFMQVVDPKTGEVHRIDLLDLVKLVEESQE